MSEKIYLQPNEKIEKITVADEDAADWVRTLVEAGFTNDEIDAIMSHLNDTYKKKMKDKEIEKEFIKIRDDLKNRKGYELSFEESEKIKQGIASRYQ